MINDYWFTGPSKFFPAKGNECTSADPEKAKLTKTLTLAELSALVDQLKAPPPIDRTHCSNCKCELSEGTSDPVYNNLSAFPSLAGYLCPLCTMRFRRLAMKDVIAADAERLRKLVGRKPRTEQP